MDTPPKTTDRSVRPNSVSDEKIGASGKLLLCLFVLIFGGFGLALVGDVLSALWR